MTDDAQDPPAAGENADVDEPSERTAAQDDGSPEQPAERRTDTDETSVETDAEPTEGESNVADPTADATAGGTAAESTAEVAEDELPEETTAADSTAEESEIPDDVRKYERFQKMDGAQYERVNEFLRDRTHITAREWAIARLCSDFRTETGVEMTKIGENLPELVPFMTDTYTPQAVNQARSSFEEKIRKAGATFLYGAMCNFFTAEELDDVMYEVTEVAKFLLEVEGVDLTVDEELEAEDRISSVMQDVRDSSEQLRHDELECPHCGEAIHSADD